MNGSFALDKQNGKFLGVCAGFARWIGVEALWVRVAFVLSVLLGAGSPLLLYFVIAFLAD